MQCHTWSLIARLTLSVANLNSHRAQARSLLTGLFSQKQPKPRAPRKAAHREAYGYKWSDEYSWMEVNHQALMQNLNDEQCYAEQHFKLLQPSAALLRKKIMSRVQAEEAVPEKWGSFSYHAEHTHATTLPTYIQTDMQGHRQVVLDPSRLQTPSELVSIGQVKICCDQSMVAYTLDAGDSTEAYSAIIQVIGQPEAIDQLSDVVSIEWAGSDALVYTHPDALRRPYKVMLHRLGQQQASDQCILQEDQPECFLELASTNDGAYITINSNAKTASEVHLLSTSKPFELHPQLVQSRTPGLEYFVSHHEGQLVVLTNAHGAVNYQVMTTPVHKPSASHWRTLVPERAGVAIQDLEVFASHAVLYERHGTRPAVSVLSLPACPETACLFPQKHVNPAVYAGSQACGEDQRDSPSHQQGQQVETQQCVHDTPNSQSQQTHHQQHSHSVPFDWKPAQQRQQQAQNHSEPDPYHTTGPRSQQQMIQQHGQQGDQQVLQSVPAHPQPLAIPPWAMSIEAGANLDYQGTTVRLKLASPVHPQHVYDYHLDSGQLQLLATDPVEGHDPQDYVCQVHYASSHDNTQVPMTLVHKKGLELDGSRPALMTVYGAYGECVETGFESERLSLLEQGWVVAMAHVRGGGELGRMWHAAGRSSNKMNSVLDLQACLDYLLQRGYTGRGLVGLQGTSAGGLLVASLLNRRPQDLLAAILRVPFVDFLTCMTRPELPLTVHEYGEWGNPSHLKVLQQMRELCPYQNIVKAKYPPVLATCAVPDSRVPVWGPAKWVARMRQHQTGSAPILLLHTLDTGHFAHEADLLENCVLEYSFLLDALHKSGQTDPGVS